MNFRTFMAMTIFLIYVYVYVILYINIIFDLQVASNSTIVTIMVPVVFAVSETLATNPLYLSLGNHIIYENFFHSE